MATQESENEVFTELKRVFGEHAIIDCSDSDVGYVICFPKLEKWQGGPGNFHKKAANTLVKLGVKKENLIAYIAKLSDEERVQISMSGANDPVFIAKLKELPDGRYAKYTRKREPYETDLGDEVREEDPALTWSEGTNEGGLLEQPYRGEGERWKRIKARKEPSDEQREKDIVAILDTWDEAKKIKWTIRIIHGEDWYTTKLPVQNPHAIVFSIADKLGIDTDELTMPAKGIGRPVIPCHLITNDNVAKLKHIKVHLLRDALIPGIETRR